MSAIHEAQVRFFREYGELIPGLISEMRKRYRSDPPRFTRRRENLHRDKNKPRGETFELGHGWYFKPYDRRSEAKRLFNMACSISSTRFGIDIDPPAIMDETEGAPDS